MTSHKLSGKTTAIYVIAMALPVIAYFYLVFRFSVNVPYWDDFEAELGFILKYLDPGSASDRFLLLFSRHNEHRIFFVRLAALADYYLTGSVNFKLLTIAGNAGMLALAAAVFASFRAEGRDRLLAFVAAAFIIFQPQIMDSMFLAMSAIQWYWSLAFVFVSLLCISAHRPRPVIAGFFAVLATFSTGSGILVFAVILPMLAIGRRYNELWIWGILFMLMLWSYMSGFARGEGQPLITALTHPGLLLNYVSYFLAAPFIGYADMDVAWSAAIRLAVIGVLAAHAAFLLRRRYYEKNPALFSMMLYLYLNVPLIAVSRSYFGAEQAIDSRYRIISTLLLAMAAMTFLEQYGGRWKRQAAAIILAAAVIFNVVSHAENIGYIEERYNTLNANIACLGLTGNWAMTGIIKKFDIYSDKQMADDTVSRSVSKGIYRPPLDASALNRSTLPVSVSLPRADSMLACGLEGITVAGEWCIMIVKATYAEGLPLDGKAYVVLSSDRDTYVFDTLPLAWNYFVSIASVKSAQPATYKVGVYAKGRQRDSLTFTGSSIEAARAQ